MKNKREKWKTTNKKKNKKRKIEKETWKFKKKRNEKNENGKKKIKEDLERRKKKEKNKLDRDTLDDWIDKLMDNIFLNEGGISVKSSNGFSGSTPKEIDIEDIVNEKQKFDHKVLKIFVMTILN